MRPNYSGLDKVILFRLLAKLLLNYVELQDAEVFCHCAVAKLYMSKYFLGY